MLTIKELLRDPVYKEYFTKPPTLPPHYRPEVKPWRLLVMMQGDTKWKGKRYGTYAEAFAALKKLYPRITNAAINCPALSFMPPIKNFKVKGKVRKVKGGAIKPIIFTKVWTPKIPTDVHHDWCPHCRRPSIFKFAATKARMIDGFKVPSSEPAMRCVICGASERIIDLRRPWMAQSWDANRPRVYEVVTD